MEINVTADWGNFDRKFSNQALKKGRLAAANDAHQAMEPFVPKLHDSGPTLRSNSFVNQSNAQIIYQQKYAKAQFYGMTGKGYRIHNYTTAGTSRRWDLRLKGDKRLMEKVESAFIEGANW